MLVYAATQVILQGFSKKSLEIVRMSVGYKLYKRIRRKNKKFLNEYIEQRRTEEVEHKKPNVVWTSWLQGMENAPYVVKKCYESLQKNITDRDIIVITEDNMSDYVEFPDYIMDKYRKGIITKTHFSDLLRVELLANYGGTWIDSTVFCSGLDSQSDFFLNSDFFVYQTMKPTLNGHALAISSWFMTACSNHSVIMLTRALLWNYWKRNNSLYTYLLLHYFFQLALETYEDEWKKMIPISKEMPHVILLRLFEPYDENVWNAIKKITPFHKLTYKYDVANEEKNDTYFRRILE